MNKTQKAVTGESAASRINDALKGKLDRYEVALLLSEALAQRDELLAIVKELKDSHDACEDGIGFLTNRVWVSMNAAIAKAERSAK